MKIVVLTNKNCWYGASIVRELRHRSVPIHAVVEIRQPLSYYWNLLRFVARKVGWLEAFYFSVVRVAAEGKHPEEGFSKQADPGWKVVETAGTNTPETEELLRSLDPDLLILGKTGILRSNILAVPKLGTLNGHPGILPEYRGIDCAKWAVHQGDFDKVGCTVHWVNAGVDTGDVVTKEPHRWTGREILGDMENDLLRESCSSLLARTAEKIYRGEKLPAERQSQGRQFHKMPLKLEREALAQLKKYLSYKPATARNGAHP